MKKSKVPAAFSRLIDKMSKGGVCVCVQCGAHLLARSSTLGGTTGAGTSRATHQAAAVTKQHLT